MSHINFFRYTCFVYLLATQRDKLDLKTVKCIFLGYSQTKKDTSIMILSPRNYISLKIYTLLKPIHTLRVLIRRETLLEFILPSIDSSYDNHTASVSPSINASALTQD